MKRKVVLLLLITMLSLSAVACSRKTDRNSDEVLTEKNDAAGMVQRDSTGVDVIGL